LIAELVPALFTKQFPMARGELLYYLAKHLAQWPEINAAIRRSVDRTRSMFVDPYRNEIHRLLSKADGPTLF
jgi:hypothetical protein